MYISAGSISISQYRGQIQKSTLYRSNYRIIGNPVSEISSLLVKFYMIFPTKLAPKPYLKSLKQQYRSIDILNRVIVIYHIEVSISKVSNLQTISNLFDPNFISNQQ